MKALGKHFYKNAYSFSYKYKKLFISFNPTRYFWGSLHGNDYRFEQQYMHKAKLESLAQFLQGENYKNGLKLSTFLKLLEQGKLYKKLDESYTMQAKEIVFFDDISDGIPLSDEEKLLKHLLNGTNGMFVDTSDLIESFSSKSQKLEFKKTLKKVQSVTVDNTYYYELYKKVIRHQIG